MQVLMPAWAGEGSRGEAWDTGHWHTSGGGIPPPAQPTNQPTHSCFLALSHALTAPSCAGLLLLPPMSTVPRAGATRTSRWAAAPAYACSPARVPAHLPASLPPACTHTPQALLPPLLSFPRLAPFCRALMAVNSTIMLPACPHNPSSPPPLALHPFLQGFDGSQFDYHGAPGTWMEILGTRRPTFSLSTQVWRQGLPGWGEVCRCRCVCGCVEPGERGIAALLFNRLSLSFSQLLLWSVGVAGSGPWACAWGEHAHAWGG